MDIVSLLNNNTIKPMEKRIEIADAIEARLLTLEEIQLTILDDKKMAIIFEAMEAVSSKNPMTADLGWLTFAQDFISSDSRSIKREASRIIGNIAHLFPDNLNVAVRSLLENTNDAGTVIRWSSAYALARIIQIPRYANSNLYFTLTELSEREQENGVKNQLLSGLKKADKIRK